MTVGSLVSAKRGRLGLALLFLLGGCAAQTKHNALADLHPKWPPPPLATRVEFVRTISSDEDLKRDTTFSQEVFNFLAGQKAPPNHLVEPMGLAVSDDGQVLYVSDFAQNAVFVFDFGKKEFRKLGPIAWPMGLALDSAQNLYVAEQRKRSITVFDPQGNAVRSISDPSLERPSGLAIDRERGRLYVADTGHTKSKEHIIKIFSLHGELIGKIGKGKGAGPGEFLFPTYVSVDRDGNLYVTDSLNCRVQVFSPSGDFVRQFGQRGDSWGNFARPKGVGLDSFGNVYVADSGWSNIQIFNQKGQVLLFFGGRGPLPGMLMNPTALTIDTANNIYVGDYLNHRVEEYRLVNTSATDSFDPSIPAPQANSGNDRHKAQSTKENTQPDIHS